MTWGDRSKSSTASPSGAVLRDVPYQVTCACGQLHSGARDSEFQVLECDACSRRLFVLPLCPYPEIEEPSPGFDAPSPQEARRTASKSRRKDPSPQDVREGTITAPAPREDEPAASDQGRLAAPPRRKVITPLRLVAVVIVVLLSVTGVWKYRQSVRAQAERSFREHSDLGDALLKDQDFAAAFAEYQKAVAALDTLGRDDGRARHVRQMFRETRAASGLASKTLPEILDDVSRWSAAEPNDWKHRFQTDHAGRWIVLDTLLRRTRREETDTVVIDFQLSARGRPVDLEVRGEAFESLKLDEPQRAIIAVELASCEWSEATGRWTVRFNPDTAFLWSSYDNCRALGFAVSEAADPEMPDEDIETERALRDRLLKQSRLIGLGE